MSSCVKQLGEKSGTSLDTSKSRCRCHEVSESWVPYWKLDGNLVFSFRYYDTWYCRLCWCDLIHYVYSIVSLYLWCVLEYIRHNYCKLPLWVTLVDTCKDVMTDFFGACSVLGQLRILIGIILRIHGTQLWNCLGPEISRRRHNNNKNRMLCLLVIINGLFCKSSLNYTVSWQVSQKIGVVCSETNHIMQFVSCYSICLCLYSSIIS